MHNVISNFVEYPYEAWQEEVVLLPGIVWKLVDIVEKRCDSGSYKSYFFEPIMTDFYDKIYENQLFIDNKQKDLTLKLLGKL
jgi:hypothetical protein